MKRLCSSPDGAHVAMIQSLLESANIPCEMRNDAVSRVMVGMQFASEIWVRDEDYAEASRLIAEETRFASMATKQTTIEVPEQVLLAEDGCLKF